MAVALDYEAARNDLTKAMLAANAAFRVGLKNEANEGIEQAIHRLFTSKTQAFREAWVGLLLVRLQSEVADLSLPYVNMGDTAYNGRTLDERVVNPFLKDQEIPSSGGPYLSALRRSRKFDRASDQGIRDTTAFYAFIDLVSHAQKVSHAEAEELLKYTMIEFSVLRDKENVSISTINRLSLRQLRVLLHKFLEVPSGGLIPLILVTAGLESIKQIYGLDWSISSQGINEADRSSGASGDISVLSAGAEILAIEVTERVVDRRRVVSTFGGKISKNGVQDYLFMTNAIRPDDEAVRIAESYFAQGHDINFVMIEEWLFQNLATIGAGGRTLFLEAITARLSASDVSGVIRVAWNELILSVVA